jgi:hypothetical protein
VCCVSGPLGSPGLNGLHGLKGEKGTKGASGKTGALVINSDQWDWMRWGLFLVFLNILRTGGESKGIAQGRDNDGATSSSVNDLYKRDT